MIYSPVGIGVLGGGLITSHKEEGGGVCCGTARVKPLTEEGRQKGGVCKRGRRE